jgi:hypothetical protein
VDAAGQAVAGASVSVESLDPSVPFSATTTTTGKGNYLLGGLQLGVRFRVTVRTACGTESSREIETRDPVPGPRPGLPPDLAVPACESYSELLALDLVAPSCQAGIQ